MKYESIGDIYSANQRISEEFENLVSQISEADAAAVSAGNWSISHLVEHVAIVDDGAAKICTKLLAAAKLAGKPSDGSFSLSAGFGENAGKIATAKVEAPAQVHPTGKVSLADSLTRINATADTLGSMRDDLESYALDGHTFPHPFLGDLNAGEWLVIAGLHKRRHASQIQNLLDKIRE